VAAAAEHRILLGLQRQADKGRHQIVAAADGGQGGFTAVAAELQQALHCSKNSFLLTHGRSQRQLLCWGDAAFWAGCTDGKGAGLLGAGSAGQALVLVLLVQALLRALLLLLLLCWLGLGLGLRCRLLTDRPAFSQ
jgi:hypothetical protein